MKKLLFLLLFLPLVSISQNDFKDNIKALLADQYDQVNIKTYDELTSIRIPIISPPNIEVNFISCLVNGVYDYFVFDTGCSAGLAINKTMFNKILKTGRVSYKDYLGDSSIITAVGNYELVKVVIMDEVIIGDPKNSFKIKNVLTMVYDSEEGPLLLGQDIIKRFSSLTIDNKNEVYIFKK